MRMRRWKRKKESEEKEKRRRQEGNTLCKSEKGIGGLSPSCFHKEE